MKQFLSVLWLLLAVGNQALAQSPTRAVSGRVTGQTGDGLPGVNIVVKGTQKGTTTNTNGQYSLAEVPAGATLTFSSIGFVAQDIAVGNRTTLDVSLSADDRSLSEVIVVGYGTQRKIETTGSIASIKSDELLQLPVANVTQGIQSRVAGVQITQNSSAPGGGASVRIRGTNSINGTSEPLYVLDGVQIAVGLDQNANNQNPLSNINPNDIESVEVLKDASSTAIYGARGANGVILITTKRGKAGTSRVSYDAYYGTQQVNKTLDVLNSTQFAALENEIFKTSVFPDPNNPGPNTDWQNLIFRRAPIQNHQLTVTGGTEKTQVAFSLNYFDQSGIIINSRFRRYSLRTNVDHRVNNWLKVGTSLLLSNSVNNRTQTANTSIDGPAVTASILGAALAAPPTLVPYREDGSVWPFGDQFSARYREAANPVGLAQILDRITNNTLLANFYADLNLAKGLTYRASFNVTQFNNLGDFYSPKSIVNLADQALAGSAQKNNQYGRSLLHESILTYATSFNAIHSLKFTGVFASLKNEGSNNNISGTQFPNDATANEAIALSTNRNVSSGRSESRLDSYLGRVNYGFRDKYFVDVTARYDGASQFGAENKYGFFPAVAAAWRVIEEPFLKGATWLSDLKLRGSYGQTGNAGAIGPYQSLALVGSGGNNAYAFNHVYTTGIAPTGIPNSELQWERSTQANLGLDLGLFNNRLNVVVDVYNKRTDNLLFVRQLPPSSGYTTITGNFATIQNRGIEMAVSGRVLDGPVKLNVSANATINRNKLLALNDLLQNFAVNNYGVLQVGQPIGVFRTYVFDGNYQTGESILPGSGSRLGGPKVRDLNGDGQISVADQTITGDPNPRLIYGFSANLSYKNFDFSTFFAGVRGNQIYNLIRYTLENPSGGRNLLAGVANRWTPTNPNNEFASVLQGGRLPISDRFLEDGSFLRCKNITLGYRLPAIKGLQAVRVYVSTNNPFTFTNYSGFDPEVNSFGNSNTQIGVDNLVYPIARSYIAGLQVSF
ncbi:SusC/RagA family TonB-linked outer membrane protein [Spirosoma montaniterrae]|uniref:SusC/RagA family TonB-linked outer membrane protein n=1 Tax=Spirosoma montaniterrae TaxID=1178516 RepID=A0A1P9X2W8_9BACT|nr:TonB-dependent receptor [Spirosoma montaniterrae]AQG81972.1 SusC/RagA family TonB-linked outer membrane protein [Spirosoma montaniterrae]